MQAKEPYRGEKFAQWRAGLHHVCFRVRSPEDIDRLFPFLQELTETEGGKIVQGPKDGPWAPGYRSILIEDPDGIRIEFNFVQGKGLLGTQDQKLFSKL
jgi:catechol 2,3-dioxygenase-like lactoylglutathione lyase family enzyme